MYPWTCVMRKKMKGNYTMAQDGPIAYLLDRNEMSKFSVVFLAQWPTVRGIVQGNFTSLSRKFLPDKAQQQ